MNPPNTIASDTLVEAIARGIRPEINEEFDDAVGGAWSRDIAFAAIRALEAAGYVIVPVEPTHEMLASVDDEGADKYVARGRAYSAWKAMIATHIEGETK